MPTATQKNRYERTRYVKLKAAFFARYGTSCACCAESAIQFLTMAHKQDDGASHRRLVGSGPARWRAAVAEDDDARFETLCYNCNCAQFYSGRCH